MWLDLFQVSPYLTVQTDQIIEGNDYMAACRTIPDYIKSYIEKAGSRFMLSSVYVDNIEIFNYFRIAENAGIDIAIDVAAGAIGGAIAGPLGVAVGIGVGIVAGLAANAVTSKALKAQKFDEYKTLLKDSFEENRGYLTEILLD